MHFLIVFLEAVFFIGLAGSMVVAIMAFVGDFTDFFEKDNLKELQHRQLKLSLIHI